MFPGLDLYYKCTSCTTYRNGRRGPTWSIDRSDRSWSIRGVALGIHHRDISVDVLIARHFLYSPPSSRISSRGGGGVLSYHPCDKERHTWCPDTHVTFLSSKGFGIVPRAKKGEWGVVRARFFLRVFRQAFRTCANQGDSPSRPLTFTAEVRRGGLPAKSTGIN